MIKAILIDSKARTVTEIQLSDDYKAIKEAIGARCRNIAVGAYLPKADVLYVDDEGLINDTDSFFEIPEYLQPLAGNAVIVGYTDDGDSCDVNSTLEDITKKVNFEITKMAEIFVHVS